MSSSENKYNVKITDINFSVKEEVCPAGEDRSTIR